MFSNGDLRAVIETQATRCKSFILAPFCAISNWGFAHNRRYLNDDEIPFDVLRLRLFYRQRGFRLAQVDTVVVREESSARLDFLIEEGAPTLIDSISVRGIDAVLDTANVRRALDLESGEPFDVVKITAGKQMIADRLINQGYIDAVVLEETALPLGEGARVDLVATPGTRVRVGEIDILGADELGADVVRSFLAVQPGQVYNQRRVLESQANLFSLSAIRFASIGRDPGRAPGDSVVNLNVQVSLAPTRAARAGGGWSTNRCFQAETTLAHRNFLGRARRLEITGQLSNIFASVFDGNFPCTDVGQTDTFRQLNFLFQTQFEEPHFFAARNKLRARLFVQRASVPDVFVRTGVGGEIAITRQLQRAMNLTLSYRPEFQGFDEESADIFFCVNFGFCNRTDISLISQPSWLAPITLAWTWNRTDNPLSPSRGFYVNSDLEVAERITGSQWRYMRFALQGADFERLSDSWIFAVRARAGIVQPTGGLALEGAPEDAGDIVNPAKRFFAGGSQSVRGFRQNLLGPTVLVLDSAFSCMDAEPLQACASRVARTDPTEFVQRPVGGNASFEVSVELRKRFSPSWGFVAFADLGQVWPSLKRLEAPIISPGVGMRWFSPLGPFRVDIGYNPLNPTLLPVVVQVEGGELVELDMPVIFDPFTYDDPSLFIEFWRRLRFHFSIGEAF